MASTVIGILTWNGYDLTRACIESLTKLHNWPVPVVVVDNGSNEHEGARLAAEFGPPVTSLRLAENAAVSGGYNAAIRWAAEQQADRILLLNNDTLATDRYLLSRLVDAAGPDVAAVGPIVVNEDGQPFSAGGRIGWATGGSTHVLQPVRTDRPYDVEWLDGPCILISIETVRRIGGLDPLFVSYWEDADWCVRARKAGFRCVVEPRTSIVHRGGATISGPQAHAYYLRNALLFTRRNGTALNNVTALAYFLFRRLPGLLVGRKRMQGRNPVPVTRALWGLGWNIRDAIRRRSWRLPASGPTIDQMPHPALPVAPSSDAR